MPTIDPPPTDAAGDDRFDGLTVLGELGDPAADIAGDVRAGLTATPRTLPAKYFYDEVGSRLFEDITVLDEYYPTRTEAAIITEHASDIMRLAQPKALVELGSGSSVKTTTLLEAMHEETGGTRYLPLDVSWSALAAAGSALAERFSWIEVDGHVADFMTDLHELPEADRRLVAFLGSTIGNLDLGERHDFFVRLADVLGDGDHLLLGADLVKEARVLVNAYDDAAGVTAGFNRNVLRVINRELDADFRVESFGHEARWNVGEERIEMWLNASRDLDVRIGALDLDLSFSAGDGIRTELSCKFRIAGLRDELARAGLAIVETWTDERAWFSLSLIRRA